MRMINLTARDSAGTLNPKSEEPREFREGCVDQMKRDCQTEIHPYLNFCYRDISAYISK